MAKSDETIDTTAASGTFGELKLMVTDYAKQQTVEPIKNLGQWAAFGIAGGVMFIIGAFLIGLGVLRLLQTFDWTVDTWSWAPYLIVFALLMVFAGLCFFAMTRTPEWMDDDK